MVIFYALIIALIVLPTEMEEESDPLEIDEDVNGEGDEASPIFFYLMSSAIAGAMYFIAGLLCFHMWSNPMNCSRYLAQDVEFLYPSLIDRLHLVQYNIRINLMKAVCFNGLIFVVSIPFLLDRTPYLILLGSYCSSNVLLGLLLFPLRNHGRNIHSQAVASHQDGSDKKIKKNSIEWISIMAQALFPILLLIFILYPLLIPILLFLLVPGFRWWQKTILPETIELWHEDIPKINPYFLLMTFDQIAIQNSRRDGREIPKTEKWYQRGMFDKKRFWMKQKAYGIGAIKELETVLKKRSLLMIPESLVVICGVFTMVSLFFDPDNTGLWAIYGLMGLVIVLVVNPLTYNRNAFEIQYLLPIAGSEIILSQFKKWGIISLIILAAGYIMTFSGPDGMFVTIPEFIVLTIIAEMMILNIYSSALFSNMHDKQQLFVDVTKKPVIGFDLSTFSVFGYMVLLFMAHFLIFNVFLTHEDNMIIQFGLVILDMLFLIFMTRYFLKRSIELYDTISILR